MELFDIERIPTKGGSLRYYIQLSGGSRPISSSVAYMEEYEDQNDLYSMKTYDAFSKKIDELKNQLVSKLLEFKSRWKIYCGLWWLSNIYDVIISFRSK